jgi:hypothetical protein
MPPRNKRPLAALEDRFLAEEEASPLLYKLTAAPRDGQALCEEAPLEPRTRWLRYKRALPLITWSFMRLATANFPRAITRPARTVPLGAAVPLARPLRPAVWVADATRSLSRHGRSRCGPRLSSGAFKSDVELVYNLEEEKTVETFSYKA